MGFNSVFKGLIETTDFAVWTTHNKLVTLWFDKHHGIKRYGWVEVQFWPGSCSSSNGLPHRKV